MGLNLGRDVQMVEETLRENPEAPIQQPKEKGEEIDLLVSVDDYVERVLEEP